MLNTVAKSQKSISTMRKPELKKALAETRKALNSMIEYHDALSLTARNQEQVITDLRKELDLYQWAFSITAGRLLAHHEDGLSAKQFTTELLLEAAKELELSKTAR